MEHRGRSTSNTFQDSLAPNSLKSLGDNKLRAFEQGSVATNNRTALSRKEREEIRTRTEAHETEEVLKEFVATFEEPANRTNKTFVKGGVFNPGSHEETPVDRGRTYRGSDRKSDSKPSKDSLQQQIAKSNAAAMAAAAAALSTSADTKSTLKKESEKRKSNLEAFKEELKRNQEERDRRRMQKRDKDGKSSRYSYSSSHSDAAADSESSHHESRHASEDPNTTNLFISTIPRAMNETSIMELFGRYGPLASVKIMYPRSEEEKSRGTNCGFVAYMSRKDAERAMQELSGSQVDSISLRMSWGRAVHIPPQPVYIPQSLRELIMPPPQSGLPFNAQVNGKNRSSKIPEIDPRDSDSMKFLEQTTIRVTIPHDRSVLCLIHRMIEFVIREGPLFEAMIMRRELNNPQYRFLFDNQSPNHTYYRWKLFSILQGDSITSWRNQSFRLFKGGSLWLPPQPQQFTLGMPDEVFEKIKKENDHDSHLKSDVNIPVNTHSTTNHRDRERERDNHSTKRGRLTSKQRDHFEDLLRMLTPERTKIGEAMLWTIDHADAAEEIIDCITESLAIPQTTAPKKISRLYLVSDILFNCSVKVTNASHYRRGFEMRLPDIFQYIHETWSNIDGRLRAEQFKQKVMNSFRAWESWAIYPSDYLIKLQNIFLGLIRTKTSIEIEEKKSNFNDDIDGKPINIDQTDNRTLALVADYDDEEDIDGKPISNIDDDIDGRPINPPQQFRARFQEEIKDNCSSTAKARFVPTKWQSIDPNEVAAQAVSISKWDFDHESANKINDETSSIEQLNRVNEIANNLSSDNTILQDSLSTSDMSEERRQKLRDVEIQVLKYTDELESGRRQPSKGFSIDEDIENYRQNLLKKIGGDDRSFSDSSRQSLNASSRYSHQRSIDEKNQDTNSRRDESSSRHKPTSNSNSTEISVKSSKDYHHYQHKRKRDERSPSHSSRSNRR